MDSSNFVLAASESVTTVWEKKKNCNLGRHATYKFRPEKVRQKEPGGEKKKRGREKQRRKKMNYSFIKAVICFVSCVLRDAAREAEEEGEKRRRRMQKRMKMITGQKPSERGLASQTYTLTSTTHRLSG